MLLTTTTFATDIDSSFFSQKDKQKHMVVSAGIGYAVATYAKKQGHSYSESIAYSIATTLLIGITKEYLDGKNSLNHSEDIGDIYADTIGAVGGAMFVYSWSF